MAGYLVTKRGLSRALIDAVGKDSELISLLDGDARHHRPAAGHAQEAGAMREDIIALDVMRLVHGVAVSSEKEPGRADLLLTVTLDGLAAKPT